MTDLHSTGQRNATPVQSPAEDTPPERAGAVGPGGQTVHDAGPVAASEGGAARHDLRRLVMLALVIVLVGAGGALLGAALWPKTYAARAEILYPITKEQPTGFLREDRNLTTQLVLLQSRAVLDPVAGAEGLRVEDLAPRVAVTLLQGSEVIQVEVRDRTRESALRTTQAIVDRYLVLNRTTTPSDARQFLASELETLRRSIADTQAALGRASTPQSTAELAALVSRQQDLQGQLDQTDLIELSGPQAQVTTEPYPVLDPVSPQVVQVTAIGAVAGLLVAVVTVGWLVRRRVRQ